MAELRTTVCNRDCPDACAIVATVEGERVVALAGDRTHPVTRGFLCHRTHKFLARQYHPERITEPRLRRGGALEPVSWDEALDFAARRLGDIRSRLGPAAIFHYRSGGTLGMLPAAVSDRFFELFGPVTVKRGDICSGAGDAAQELDFGVCDSSDLDDLAHARHILLWGKNPFVSSPHLVPRLREARAAGAHLALVDPVHHRTASLCERHVQPRPGGDFALALAVGERLFARALCHPDAARYCEGLEGFRALCQSRSLAAWCELADVAPEDAEDLARRFGEGPTTILVGWGMGRRRNGGAIVRALDALALVSGNVGVPGSGASFYYRRRRAFVSPARGLAARTLCEPLFGREITEAKDPPVAGVWITAANPVCMLPDSHATAAALAGRELVVVADAFLTDTAALAHLVLPTPTLLEADDLCGAYGHHHIGVARPVVAPPPGVKSDLEIFQALAQRFGFGAELAGSARAWKERLLAPELAAHGVDLATLERGAVRNPLAPQVLFEGRRFPTPSGRARLMTEVPGTGGGLAQPPDHDYPLVLMSLSTPSSQSSQWVGRPPSPVELSVHPDAAAGLADGAPAALVSRSGAMRVRVRHDARQRRDVALVPKGGHLRDGACANALVRAETTDLGEGGALYDEPVRLEPLG
ncbi:MAG: molybdopterin-dependent oxidoreductase [Myxococcales bacterium]|nr:molybdopterin-dependent oxidoreductase [Myxococcales bacterium]